MNSRPLEHASKHWLDLTLKRHQKTLKRFQKGSQNHQRYLTLIYAIKAELEQRRGRDHVSELF